MKNRLAQVLAGCTVLLLVLLAPSAVGAGAAAAEGSLTEASFQSATLKEAISYNVYLPAGYEGSTDRYPVLYLLHGRGDSMSAWTQMKGALDALIASGEIQPTIAIMPDAPVEQPCQLLRRLGLHRCRSGTQSRDRLHEGSDRARRRDLPDRRRPHRPRSRGLFDGRLRRAPLLARASRSLRRVDRAQPRGLRPDPAERLEHARVRRVRARQEPLRRLGLQEAQLPGLFTSFAATGLPLPMFIAVGDDEFKNPDPKDAIHDLDFEAHVLFNQAVRVPNLTAELRVVDGGHDWDVWGPTFVEGAKYIFQFLNQTPVTPVKATLDRHRPGGARRRRRRRRGRQRLPGARRRRLHRGPAVRGRQGPRAGQGLAGRHAAVDARARHRAARAGIRRRDRPRRQRGRRRVHDR